MENRKRVKLKYVRELNSTYDLRESNSIDDLRNSKQPYLKGKKSIKKKLKARQREGLKIGNKQRGF